jgi:hypothetical protein
MRNRLAFLLLVVPFLGWAITLPSVTVFPMRVGLSQTLTNGRGDALNWEVVGYTILDNENYESGVNVDWKISHSGSVSFTYIISFVVTPEGEVYVDSLSDGVQKRSFGSSLLLIDANGNLYDGVYGEGIVLTNAKGMGRLSRGGKTFENVWVVTLSVGSHRYRIFFTPALGIVGVDGESSYFLR